MTRISTLLFLLISIGTLAQTNLAIIKDKDGFTNVREAKGTNSSVIAQISNGEFFTFQKGTDDWWEISKLYVENGSVKDLTGFVHKSRIQPINTLTNNDKRELIKQTFDKELDLIKKQDWEERKKHHEPKFDMILDISAEYITKTKDIKLLRTFIEILKLDAGSADEAPTWTFGQIFIKHPDWTIEQMRIVGLDQNLIDRLEWGFENTVSNSDNYSELKKKIDLLK